MDLNLDDYNDYGDYKASSDFEEMIALERMHPCRRMTIVLYHDLHLLVTKLKIEIALEGRDLPKDIFDKLLFDTLQREKRELILLDRNQKNKFIVEHDIFIKTELKNRLTKLGITYDESDNYVNVVNYAKATGLNFDKDKFVVNDTYRIEQEIVPWLGTTGIIFEKTEWGEWCWQYTEDQVEKIIETNKRLNGGAKIHKKKSRKFRSIHKNSKINKKI